MKINDKNAEIKIVKNGGDGRHMINGKLIIMGAE